VRWSCVAYAAGGANYHTWLPIVFTSKFTDADADSDTDTNTDSFTVTKQTWQ